MNNEILFYKTPAEKYINALPLGNGRMGAMVCGGITKEKINLNEDTLWSGFPRSNWMYNTYERFTKRLRKKILEEEDLVGAEDFADRLQGQYNESYIAAGELLLNFAHGEKVSDYVRGLDIKNGVAFTKYNCGGINYTREVFVSSADDIMVVHICCDRDGALDFNVGLSSMIRHTVNYSGANAALCGRAPRHVEPQYLEYTSACREAIVYDEEWEFCKGLNFECHIKAVADKGKISSCNDGVYIKGATDVTLYLWLGTNYNKEYFLSGKSVEDYCIRGMDISSVAQSKICFAADKGYASVFKAHCEDMNEYYGRVCFEPEYDKTLDSLDTAERKQRYINGNADAGFEKQIFDFGRYLLYSSSRPGTQAANLQGIWCWEMRPAWCCSYTININTQMNYWGVEVMNMPECHMPLMDLLDGISHTGADTASGHYGARGFCAHHNIDLWRATIPMGMGETDNMWSIFPSGGIWLSLNVWEHFMFTGDVEFLKKYFHILKGSALFAVDMMCEMKDGYLGMCPATVPERRFTKPDGTVFAVGAGSTFDYELVTELFDAVRKAVEVLGVCEDELLCDIDRVSKRFPPVPISGDGFITDWQFECTSSPYMWLGLLYGVYPGYCLMEASEEVVSAAKKTLEQRDATTNSFANCWYAGAWARIGNGDKAYEKLRYHISNVTFENLLGANASYPENVFQIDANLGIIAAMGEMFVQSTQNSIAVLPALPCEWKNGSIKGLATRCGCIVDISWKNGKLKELSIISSADKTIQLYIGNDKKAVTVELAAGQRKIVSDSLL